MHAGDVKASSMTIICCECSKRPAYLHICMQQGLKVNFTVFSFVYVYSRLKEGKLYVQ